MSASYNTVKASGPAIIPSNLNVPSRVSSPSALRAIKDPTTNNTPAWANSLAKDMEALSKNVDSVHSKLATTPQTIDQILITNNNQGQIVAAIGDFLYEGQYYANFFNEIHVSDPSLQNNPANAVFNANTDGSVTIGQNGFVSVLDPYAGIAAYLGTQLDSNLITGAADNGAGLIRLTVPHTTLATGNVVQVRNMQNAGVPNATGTFTVTLIDASHVDLQQSVFAGSFAAPTPPFGIDTTAPTIDRVLQVSAVAASGTLIEVTTAIAHTYLTGDRVNATLPGVPNGTGQFTITVVNATSFTLDGSTFAGAYTSGGTVLRFFAGMLAQTFATGPSFENYTLRAFADGSLKINNATISLNSSAGQILLDPSGPDIFLTNTANAAEIIITSNPPAILVKDLAGATVAELGVNSAGHGVLILNSPSLNNVSITGGTISGTTIGGGVGSATTATVRNAAGTGTSVLTFNASGQLTNYTP